MSFKPMLATDADLNCGAGFTDEQRAQIWNRQANYIGALAKVKYFPVGMKDAPRHPVFLDWRDRSDTSC